MPDFRRWFKGSEARASLRTAIAAHEAIDIPFIAGIAGGKVVRQSWVQEKRLKNIMARAERAPSVHEVIRVRVMDTADGSGPVYTFTTPRGQWSLWCEPSGAVRSVTDY